MKLLKDMLFGVPIETVSGSTHIEISDVTFDSREVKKNVLFVAIKGTTHDGHAHIADAIQKGATAVLCEELPASRENGVTYVSCINSRRALATVANHWYDHPSAELKLVGVTGTNGKTSVATMAYQLFHHMGYTTGLLSTVEIRIGNSILPSTHTTPDALSINKILRQMVGKAVQNSESA